MRSKPGHRCFTQTTRHPLQTQYFSFGSKPKPRYRPPPQKYVRLFVFFASARRKVDFYFFASNTFDSANPPAWRPRGNLLNLYNPVDSTTNDGATRMLQSSRDVKAQRYPRPKGGFSGVMQILPRGSQICYMVRNVRPFFFVRSFVRHARGIALPVTLGSYPLGRLQAYRSRLRILRAICIGTLCIPGPDIQPCAGVAPLAEALGSGLWWLAEVLVVHPACVATVSDRI